MRPASDPGSRLCPRIGAAAHRCLSSTCLSQKQYLCQLFASGCMKCAILITLPALEFLLEIQNFWVSEKEPSIHVFTENNRCRSFRAGSSITTGSKKLEDHNHLSRVPRMSLIPHSGVGVAPLSTLLWLFLITPCTWGVHFASQFCFGPWKLFPSSHMSLAITTGRKLFLVFPLLFIFPDLPSLGKK